MKIIIILIISLVIGLVIGDKLYYMYKKYNYNKCYKQNAGANFISCDTDRFFVYRAEELYTTPTNVKLEIKNIQNDVNCVYEIKDSVQGKFKVNCSHIKEIVKQFGEDKTLIAIIFQESGFNPVALNRNTNGTFDKGIFQLNSKYWTMKDGNIHHSINQAKLCKKQNGYDCWVAYTSGDYKKYLDEAELLLSKLN